MKTYENHTCLHEIVTIKIEPWDTIRKLTVEDMAELKHCLRRSAERWCRAFNRKHGENAKKRG